MTRRNKSRRDYQIYRHPHIKTEYNRLFVRVQKLILAHRSKSWNDLIDTPAKHIETCGHPKTQTHSKPFPRRELDTDKRRNTGALLRKTIFTSLSSTFAKRRHLHTHLRRCHKPPPLRRNPDLHRRRFRSSQTSKIRSPQPRRHPNHALKLLSPPTIQAITNIFNAAFHLKHFPRHGKR